MITKKLQTAPLKFLTLTLMLSLVFGANIALAQNYITTPDGPPPGNNAPAPVHEGSTGQGKYWSSGEIPPYSLASLLNIVVGMFSEWVIADGAGVAATQFCLGTAEEIDGSGFHEDGSTAGLNCITDAIGWPGTGDGGDGQGDGQGDGGDGVNSSIPPGSEWHQLLYYSNETSSWLPLPLTRIWTPLETYLTGGTGIADVIDNNLPLPGPSIEFGSLNSDNGDIPYEYDPDVIDASGDAYFNGLVSFFVRGLFSATTNGTGGALNSLTLSGTGTSVVGPFRVQHTTGENVPLNSVLVSSNTNGTTDWSTANNLGLSTELITQSELDTALGSLDGSGIPDGTSSGEILWWDDIAQEWKISVGGGFMNNQGFVASNNNSLGQTFAIIDTPGSVNPCTTNSVLRVETGWFPSLRTFDCISQLQVTPALFTISTVSTLINSSNEFKVTSPNAVFTKLSHTNASERPVCAENDGDIKLCDNLSTGTWTQSSSGNYTFTVPAGVYEINYSLRGAGGGGGGGGFGKALYLMGEAFSRTAMAGGGGGGGGGKGEFQSGTMEVFPGQEIQVYVGFGGSGGCAVSYAGGTPCFPYGTSLSGNFNGSNGQDGADSSINGPAAGQDVVAEGGKGGEGGFSFNVNMVNPATALELGIATPGGVPGENWDGTEEAEGGDNGQIRHEFSNASIIDDSNYDGGAPNHPTWGGTGSSIGSCLRQIVIAYGGQGGSGAGGAPGGSGGDAYTHGNFEPSTCNLDSGNYLQIGANAHGENGTPGTSFGSGSGGGGGGGGSSIPGPYSQTDTGTYSVGKGGVGGKGADGFVYFSW